MRIKIFIYADGNFKLSVMEDGNMLTTSRGYPVLMKRRARIFQLSSEQMVVSEQGDISYKDEDGFVIPTGQESTFQV